MKPQAIRTVQAAQPARTPQERPLPASDEIAWLGRYLAWGLMLVGGLEWSLGRTVSRMAAAPNLEGAPRQIIEVLGRTGLALVSPAMLLALALYLLSAVKAGSLSVRQRSAGNTALALYLGVFGLLAAVHTFYPTLPWLNVLFNLLALLAAWWIALYGMPARGKSLSLRLGILCVAVGYSGWFYYVLQQALSTRGQPLLGAPLLALNLGEVAAVAAPFAFFAAVAVPYGQWRHVGRWTLPVAAAALFSAGNVADAVFDQGFSGVFAIWSLGFNLFLPWPLYAIALMLFLYCVLTGFLARGERARAASPNTGLGLLLLLYAGFTLQVPYQVVLALLSLMLLSGPAKPFDEPRPAPVEAEASDSFPQLADGISTSP